MRFVRLIFLFLILLFFKHTYSQSVAVVLSGGGSKGLAHIGVLKALEENGIPIDYIAGTSIGAIIGGLYASGYSPDSIEKIFLSDDLIHWATGEMDSKYFYYYKKPEPDPSWITVKFDYDKGWSYTLPTNIISPVQMDFAFNEIFASAGAVADNDFNKLFVPFRCIASDIGQNRQRVMKDGDLPMAIRASMTFPFYFKPVKINGDLMYDGGMYNNFPADIVYHDFNPDYIIGSQVAFNAKPPEENNLVSILYNMLMVKSNYSFMCDNSIMIKPDIPSNVNVIDFSERRRFIDSGYTATINKIKAIRQFVHINITNEQINQKRHDFNSKKPVLFIDNINITGLKKNQKTYVLKNLNQNKKKISFGELKKNYFRLITDKKIESAFPQLYYDKIEGSFDMNLDIKKEKHFAASYGGVVSSSSNNETFLNFTYNKLTSFAFSSDLNFYFGRFYNAAQLSGQLDFTGRHPFYIRGATSLNRWDYSKTQSYFINDKSLDYLIQHDQHTAASVGMPVSYDGKIEISSEVAHLRNDYYQTNYFTRTDTTDKNVFFLYSANILLDINTIREKQFATKGFRFFWNVRYVTGEETNDPGSTSMTKSSFQKDHNWLQSKIIYENYFKNINNFTLGLYSELHISNQTNFANYTSSVLAAPAFKPIPESKTYFNQMFIAYNYAGLGLKIIYNINKSINLRVEGYCFQPYKEILRNNDFSAYAGKPFDKRYFMGLTALVLKTPIGPLSLSANYFDNLDLKDKNISFVLSFGYVIFNRRALE